MIDITTYQNGIMLQQMTLLDETEADLNGDWVAGHWSESEYYVDNGAVELRPLLAVPETHALLVGADWDVLGVPEGSAVFVDGEEVGTTDATGLTLSFQFPGVYAVRIVPPFPTREASCEVTVS